MKPRREAERGRGAPAATYRRALRSASRLHESILAIAKDADVTVVLYNQSKVIANYTFRKGELKAADVDRIVADVSKIVK